VKAAPKYSFPKIGWVGGAIIAAFVFVAVAGTTLSPYPATARAVQTLESPSAHDLLGTNQIGQDLLSQLIAGTRVSLEVALMAGVGAILLGAVVGVAAGWLGGWLDVVLMRVTDIALALPRLPLLILIGSFAGRSLEAISLVIAVLFWPGTARVVRSQVQSLRRQAHLTAARGFGAGPLHLLRSHLLPETAPVMLASLIAVSGRAVLLQTGLAFLGMADPKRVSWGSIMNDAFQSPGIFFTRIWMWWLLPPVIAIVLVVLGLTFLGMALEQRINPRLARHVAVDR
jgi:peptide/nickel transport system permease protein